MIGTILNGTRAHALEIMVQNKEMVVHETFAPGVAYELDAHKECFVDQDGNDVTESFFENEAYQEGWHIWGDDDETRVSAQIEQDEQYERQEALEEQRRADANIDGYSMRDFTATVLSDESHIYYRKKKSGNTGRALIRGFRLTVENKIPSVDYYIRYDSTGCLEWLTGGEVFASKLDLTAAEQETDNDLLEYILEDMELRQKYVEFSPENGDVILGDLVSTDVLADLELFIVSAFLARRKFTVSNLRSVINGSYPYIDGLDVVALYEKVIELDVKHRYKKWDMKNEKFLDCKFSPMTTEEAFIKYFKEYDIQLKFCNYDKHNIVDDDLRGQYNSWLDIGNYAKYGGNMD